MREISNPLETQVSPQFTSKTFGSKPTLDQKILIFENRELGWRFDIAKATEKIPHAGYAVISILFAYFEMIGQYSTGFSSKNDPKVAFREGVSLVYPAIFTKDQLNTIYDRVRCGMFHNGYTKFGTLIRGDDTIALDIDKKNTVLVNPHKLRADLYMHFIQYVAMLTNVTKTRERANFEKIFDADTNPPPQKA